jgi:hypothetical protein
MAYDPNIRVSDADRDRTAALLREHFTAGRLAEEEFNERLDRVYAARTIGELDPLLADLPTIDLYRLPDATLTRDPRRTDPGPGRRRRRRSWRRAWGAWLVISLVCLIDWATGAGHGFPWPVLVIVPLAAVIGGAWVVSYAFRSDQVPGLNRGSPGELPGPGDDLPGRPGR